MRSVHVASSADVKVVVLLADIQRLLVGDLGTTSTEVEKALETNFDLANKWDCILLLDEADVFLAARTKADFQRNGLVAGLSSLDSPKGLGPTLMATY
jgi:hypothetical protein